jgi:hypothetical protein
MPPPKGLASKHGCTQRTRQLEAERLSVRLLEPGAGTATAKPASTGGEENVEQPIESPHFPGMTNYEGQASLCLVRQEVQMVKEEPAQLLDHLKDKITFFHTSYFITADALSTRRSKKFNILARSAVLQISQCRQSLCHK